MNTGKNNLTEVNITAKISVQSERNDIYNTTYLHVGDADVTIPVIEAYDSEKGYRPHVYTMHMSQAAFQEYAKSSIYRNEIINDKAAKQLLTLDDIVAAYGERTAITIYVFGNDEKTGIRRMFSSKEYRFKNRARGEGDVISGKFKIINDSSSLGNRKKAVKKLREIISEIC